MPEQPATTRPGELSLRQDVVNVILSRGELRREEIQRVWELDDETYFALKSALDTERLLEGMPGVGGFRARIARRPLPPDEPGSVDGLFRTTWELQAVERLAGLLSHKALEDLLGDLVYTLRRVRMKATGEDRRGTKRELAAALLIARGIDLFRDRDVRQEVASRAHAESPRRWTPGKDAAIAFVHAAGFPRELAGIPADDSPQDFEYLEGRVELPPLQPFQLEVQAGLMKQLAQPSGRCIVTLPTGAGKTRTAVDTLRDFLTAHWNETGDGSAVVWLAHTEELCEQAYQCFRQVWQSSVNVAPLLLFRFWGRYTQDLVRHRDTIETMAARCAVFVSTPQRVLNLMDNRVEHGFETLQKLQRACVVLVVDEAHRAGAASYRRIIDAFASARAEVRVVGLTATPFRAEYDARDPDAGTRSLRALFGTIVEPLRTLGEDARAALQDKGFLARPAWETIRTRTHLRAPPLPSDRLTEDDVEKVDHTLRIRADNPDRRMTVLEAVAPLCANPGHRIIYFGPSVLDAECMAFLLRSRGIAAAFVSGGTRDVTRRRLITEFREGALQVLCNCEVLTTGFDAPRVTHVVMARPTVSQVLYEQMVGRGLRGPGFGGTASCVIVDLEDNYRSDRAVLGYQAFRELWTRGRRLRAGARGEIPADPPASKRE
ncbi:MAG: DEAD/DEAH box helicase family protein [Betaproteobacteria bacterium]|nr:DEAD/DEAH box helicase family protein [Betaproteobacteria bacterium]